MVATSVKLFVLFLTYNKTYGFDTTYRNVWLNRPRIKTLWNNEYGLVSDNLKPELYKYLTKYDSKDDSKDDLCVYLNQHENDDIKLRILLKDATENNCVFLDGYFCQKQTLLYDENNIKGIDMLNNMEKMSNMKYISLYTWAS